MRDDEIELGEVRERDIVGARDGVTGNVGLGCDGELAEDTELERNGEVGEDPELERNGELEEGSVINLVRGGVPFMAFPLTCMDVLRLGYKELIGVKTQECNIELRRNDKNTPLFFPQARLNKPAYQHAASGITKHEATHCTVKRFPTRYHRISF